MQPEGSNTSERSETDILHNLENLKLQEQEEYWGAIEARCKGAEVSSGLKGEGGAPASFEHMKKKNTDHIRFIFVLLNENLGRAKGITSADDDQEPVRACLDLYNLVDRKFNELIRVVKAPGYFMAEKEQDQSWEEWDQNLEGSGFGWVCRQDDQLAVTDEGKEIFARYSEFQGEEAQHPVSMILARTRSAGDSVRRVV
jgi:hypothetical protein